MVLTILEYALALNSSDSSDGILMWCWPFGSITIKIEFSNSSLFIFNDAFIFEGLGQRLNRVCLPQDFGEKNFMSIDTDCHISVDD
jgi:hypothetical protein